MKLIIFDFNRTLYDPEKGVLIEGAAEIIEHCSRSHRLALISMREKGRDGLIGTLGIASFFSSIVITDAKTAELFKEVIASCGATPGETVIIGDRVTDEIAIGKEIGTKAIWFRAGKFASIEPIPGREPDHVISTLVEAKWLVG